MSLGTSNRDGGKTSESGHLRALAKIVAGDVIEGLAVSQRAAGVNMSVDVAVGDAFVRRSDGSYAHPVFNDAVYNQVISAADGSNPRRDIVVIYVDYGQTPSTAVSNNTNGVVKIKVVNGTPAGSPSDPNAAAIQASVGSGNPYSILARVRVPASQTSISNSLIDDLRTLISVKPGMAVTASIPDAGVTTPKIADYAVTPAKLGTPAAFSVYKNAAQSIANGTFVVVSWPAEQFDTVNGHDNSTNNSRFTIPAGYSGKWFFTGAVNFAAGGGATRICAFYKNGAMYNGKRETVAGANTYTALHAKVIDVVAGDYIEIAGYQDSGGALNAQGAAMPGLDIGMFDGFFLGKT